MKNLRNKTIGGSSYILDVMWFFKYVANIPFLTTNLFFMRMCEVKSVLAATLEELKLPKSSKRMYVKLSCGNTGCTRRNAQEAEEFVERVAKRQKIRLENLF